MLRSAIRRSRASSTRYVVRRGALLIRGPPHDRPHGSRFCRAAWRTLHRARDTKLESFIDSSSNRYKI